jgi:hypothetical protein
MDYRVQPDNERGKRVRHVPAPKDEPTLRQSELLDAMVAACAMTSPLSLHCTSRPSTSIR